ncbi:jg17908 [Pararge aegeria aegeria]|uniref:Jg17908 protein n=1 Tax=Pararge aegeria aegeria TaxID=348720 RepID=A0A8S4SM00_9NEOP|nr:jg17908 [Pararge aegeria aegeria]
MNIATIFYQNLYRSTRKTTSPTPIRLNNNDPVLPFIDAEIELSIKKLTVDKCPGPDGITNDVLKAGCSLLNNPLTKLFNLILQQKTIPNQWTTSEIILIYKNGDAKQISNYRPISLISCIYKVFATTLLRRVTKIIDENQSIEQAGFMKNYSTLDHIHTLKLVIEKYVEFTKPLYIVFIDYSKAFDSLHHNSIWQSLNEEGNSDYIELIRIYETSRSRVRLESPGPFFKIERGVKQGDPLSPKLFITVLESIFRKLNWENKGIKINGKYLSHLRFADDLVLLSEDPKELQYMLESLNRESETVGLEMNKGKTKVMTNKERVPITIKSTNIEYVKDYIYLGHLISFEFCTDKEIDRRIKSTWNKYWAMKEIAEKTWARAAMDRKSWLLMEEAFTAKCGPYNKY